MSTDSLAQRVLSAIENPLPITNRPFQVLAKHLDLPEDTVLKCLRDLEQQGLLREISAIFDGKELGYQTSLVAVIAEDPDQAASYINKHSGVSHNYRRNHRFNLWFTFASPPGRDIQQEVEQLCAPFHPEAIRLLPSLKTYKLRVSFASASPGENTEIPSSISREKVEREKQIDPRVVRALQAPWPIEKDPWALLAQRENLDPGELMGQAEIYFSAKIIRRISGVVRHRKMGFTHNGMNCFILPEERLDEAGAILSSYREVSHCYHRKTYQDWPFNLYAMSHSKSKEDAEKLILHMTERLDFPEMVTLYSDKEYKKERVRYFLEGSAGTPSKPASLR